MEGEGIIESRGRVGSFCYCIWEVGAFFGVVIEGIELFDMV